MDLTLTQESPSDLAENLELFASDQINRWFNLCDQFLVWERSNILLQKPTSEKLRQHQTTLKFLLRTIRFMQDPDYPNRSLSDEINWRLQKLEDSYLMFHQPMSEQESNSILEKCFPDER